MLTVAMCVMVYFPENSPNLLNNRAITNPNSSNTFDRLIGGVVTKQDSNIGSTLELAPAAHSPAIKEKRAINISTIY
jgi:hypothetical protein